jgi:DNA-directed RNA polymerase specialized sigma24 family protein
MPPDDCGSITRYLIILKDSDDRVLVDDTINTLWERYFQKLVRLARDRLRNLPHGQQHVEVVAHHALESFCIRAADGKFPQLDDRDDLWRILITIASRKVAEIYRKPSMPEAAESLLDHVVGREPSPELAATTADTLQWLLDALPNETFRAIAIKKMEGYTNKEIAKSLTCCEATIELKLRHMRAIWLDLTRAESTESDA